MSTHESRVATDLLDEPHVEGRRIPVLTLVERVEGRGLAPGTVAERHDLDISEVYAALLYYHEHPREFDALREERERLIEDVKRDIDRPADVEPTDT